MAFRPPPLSAPSLPYQLLLPALDIALDTFYQDMTLTSWYGTLVSSQIIDRSLLTFSSNLDPLTLGATPKQVWIDGIPQISKPKALIKSIGLQKEPKTPSWDEEAKQAVKYEGLPPLKGDRVSSVAFTNIKSVWSRDETGNLKESLGNEGVMHFVDGALACSSPSCPSTFSDDTKIVDLEGGSMGPGLISFGSPLGLEEIEQEPSTRDGYAYGPFDKEFTIVGDLARAADGLAFEGRSML